MSLWQAFKDGAKEGVRTYFDPLRPSWWKNRYYDVKNWLFPWNVIKLTKLDRNSYHEPCERMEEAIMEMLSSYINGNQPFHMVAGVPYEKRPSIETHRRLLEQLYGQEAQAEQVRELFERVKNHESTHDIEHSISYTKRVYPVYNELLNILEWWQNGRADIEDGGIFLAAIAEGKPHEEALTLAQEHDRARDEKFLFVVKHRGYFWS